MIARFIFAETVYGYEHTAPRFVTKDIQLPDGFVPECTIGHPRKIGEDKFGCPITETYYSPMDLKGVELIDEKAKDEHAETKT